MVKHIKLVGDWGPAYNDADIPAHVTNNTKLLMSDQSDGGYGDWHHDTVAWDGKLFHAYKKHGPGSMGEGEPGEDDPWHEPRVQRNIQGHAGLKEAHSAHNDYMGSWHINKYVAHHVPDTHRPIKLPGRMGELMHKPGIAADVAEEHGYPKMAHALRNVKAGPLDQAYQEHRFGKSADGSVHMFGPGYHWIFGKGTI